ncbi:hypothetical protein FI667_g2785, partial [Globisporangium splendens]
MQNGACRWRCGKRYPLASGILRQATQWYLFFCVFRDARILGHDANAHITTRIAKLQHVSSRQSAFRDIRRHPQRMWFMETTDLRRFLRGKDRDRPAGGIVTAAGIVCLQRRSLMAQRSQRNLKCGVVGGWRRRQRGRRHHSLKLHGGSNKRYAFHVCEFGVKHEHPIALAATVGRSISTGGRAPSPRPMRRCRLRLHAIYREQRHGHSCDADDLRLPAVALHALHAGLVLRLEARVRAAPVDGAAHGDAERAAVLALPACVRGPRGRRVRCAAADVLRGGRRRVRGVRDALGRGQVRLPADAHAAMVACVIMKGLKFEIKDCGALQMPMGSSSKTCKTTAVVCVMNLLIAVESCVVILALDRHFLRQRTGYRGDNAAVNVWLLVQYVSFGTSVVFAFTIWITRTMKAVALLANALFFALYTLQWLIVALVVFIGGYTTAGIVFVALALHPFAGFFLSRSLGRDAREDAERQEALEIVFEHEDSLYHSAEEVREDSSQLYRQGEKSGQQHNIIIDRHFNLILLLTMSGALGIDVGTTAVKCAIVSRESRQVLAVSNVVIDEVSSGDRALQHGEQCVERVMCAVQRALAALPEPLRQRVESVGICGQMHGILWWRSDATTSQIGKALDSQHDGEDSSSLEGLSKRAWSHLVTWQDQRCSPAFLKQCAAKIAAAAAGGSSSTPLATGYGMATYAHALAHAPETLDGFDACGTIQDFLAFALCGHASHRESTIDSTNAASWGCFNVNDSNWSVQAVTALQIPFEMLPTVKQPGEIIGSVATENKFGLPSGIPVHVPIGDHPSSVITAIVQQQQPATGTATLDANQTSYARDGLAALLVVNFGTSAQLAMVLSEDEVRQIRSTNKSFEVRPFVFENQFLGVAASLSGGNIYAWFVKQCLQWVQELQMSSAESASADDDARWYARLIDLGMQKTTTDLEFLPTLSGERSDPTMKGSIQQLRMSNWSMGDISAALCKGLIDNLFTMVPEELHGAIRERKPDGAIADPGRGGRSDRRRVAAIAASLADRRRARGEGRVCASLHVAAELCLSMVVKDFGSLECWDHKAQQKSQAAEPLGRSLTTHFLPSIGQHWGSRDAARRAHGARVLRNRAQLLAAALLRRVAARRDVSDTGDSMVNKSSVTKKDNADTEGNVRAPKATKAAEDDNEDDDAHTTTIKMADGDEITIKRAANSKNKITTISTHEDGKITIENREKKKKTTTPDANGAGAAGTATPTNAPSSPFGSKPETPLRQDTAAVVPADAADEVHAAEKTQRAVDFVDVYEADDKDGDAALGEAGTETAAATTDKENNKTSTNDEKEEEDEDDNTHEVVVGNKKVTFVQVSRTLTKVSLSNVHDDNEEAQPNSATR